MTDTLVSQSHRDGIGGSVRAIAPRQGRRYGTSKPSAAKVPGPIRVLQGLTIFLVFGQRLSLPFSSSYVSFSLLAVLVITVVFYRYGVLVEDRRRTQAYVAGIGLCLLAALFAFIGELPNSSISSVLLLMVVYAPFCLVLRADLRPYYAHILRTFCGCMVVIAFLAVGQLLGQAAHVWTYTDLFAKVVPHAFVVQGYETAYPIVYGSSLIKSNGVFCLEASFCSQLIGLAIIGQLVLGERRWRLALFGLALLSTVSGTGLLLLAAGLPVQMVRRGVRWSLRVIAIAAVSVGLAALTPSGKAALGRVGEVHASQSSGNQRFLAPYQRAWDDLGAGGRVLLLGDGPGYADREAERVQVTTGAPAVSPPISKLLTEYGLIAGTTMLLAIVAFLTIGVPSGTMAVALLVFYFFLSASLLQGQTVYISWLLAGVFGSAGRRLRTSGPGGLRRSPKAMNIPALSDPVAL